MTHDKTQENSSIGPIVSSSHLATGAMPALSEMEYALTVASNAFGRWMVRCMSAAGLSGLTPLEVQILHSVNHRDREKTLGDLCTMLNIEDTHVVSYAIKKLVSLDLVVAGKRGKEKTVRIADKGRSMSLFSFSIRPAQATPFCFAVSIETGLTVNSVASNTEHKNDTTRASRI